MSSRKDDNPTARSTTGPRRAVDSRPVIGVTMGDPGGVGAEVIVKALADRELRKRARFVIYGLNELLAYAADLAEIEPYWHRVQHDSDRASYALVHDVVVLDYDEYSMLGGRLARPSKEGGSASVRFLDDAVAATRRPHDDGGIDAIVTGPICKASWALAGFGKYPGHTEFLQARTKAKRSVMMFDAPGLRVSLATVHLPLMDLRNVLTIGRVFDAIDLGREACVRLGIEQPRIGVCGLNPHAGEGGLFGDEENRIIKPAMDMARGLGIDVTGPLPADTLFVPGKRDKFDLIVAMYHDQGLIPVKMLAFDKAVNVTLGLPLIRTSVDHGTAFDIVGKNQADAGSMTAAIKLAIELSRNRDAGNGQAEAREAS